MRIRGREEETDSPQNSEDKTYQYTSEDSEGQDQRVQGDGNGSRFPHPRRRPSDVPLLHNDHTPFTSSVPDLNVGSASRSYTVTDGELSDSTITPRATPIPKKTSLFTENFPIQIHVTKEQEQHSSVDVEIRPGSSESVSIPSTLPTSRTDSEPSPRLPFNLQRAESPNQTSKPMMNDTTYPKPQYLDYFVASPVSSPSSPRRRLFSRFSLSSSSSGMSGLITSSSTMCSVGNDGTRVVFNQNLHIQTSDSSESTGEYDDSMPHVTLSRSNSYSRQSKQEIKEDEEDEGSSSVARFSPSTSVKTIYAI